MIKNNKAQNRELLQDFAEFAKRNLLHYSDEVETIYQNEKVQQDDFRHACQKHQQILEMELHDKIDEMLTIENAFLGPLFNDIKDDFIQKLRRKELARQALSGNQRF